MLNEEAKKNLKEWFDNDGIGEIDTADFILALILAVNALDKQIPKKPVKTICEIVCPTCRTLVGSSPYCRYCGQALDWSDSE